MGLDITTYQTVERIGDVDADSPDDCRNIYFDRADRADGLTDGLYRVSGKRVEFRAGSYSGYNAWRAWLCETMLGVLPETVWANKAVYIGKPFVELIDFSDCDGTIGPEVSAKLAKDFADNIERAQKAVADDDDGRYYMSKYNQWHAAFALAAGHGVVTFH